MACVVLFIVALVAIPTLGAALLVREIEARARIAEATLGAPPERERVCNLLAHVWSEGCTDTLDDEQLETWHELCAWAGLEEPLDTDDG